jgi:5-methylcytosine-specific restriction protein A
MPPARRLCADCPNPAPPGHTRCPPCDRTHRTRYTHRNQQYRGTWPTTAARRIANYRARHGDICPGYGTEPHPTTDWVCDHDLGPMCRSCNSRKAATTDRARRRRSIQ